MAGRKAKPYERAVVIAAPPERVWSALTTIDALRAWFAEHVEVEPRVGGAYRFWGRHTIFVPTREQANQTITILEPERHLAYSWTWAGLRTEVGIELTIDAGGTRVCVTHRFLDRSGGSPDDFWKVALVNLREYVTTGRPLLLPDLTPVGDRSRVRVSIEIDAAPEDVFRALTEPELLNQWIASNAHVDLARGEYSYGWTYTHDGAQLEGGPRRVRVLEPNRVLETDWHFVLLGEHSYARWELEPIGSDASPRTRVTITHAEMRTGKDHADHVLGWAAYLGELKRVSEASAARASAPGRT